MIVYFDNSATTVVSEKVKDIVLKAMIEDYGNPSSMHLAGVKAEDYIKDAKKKIASIMKVDEKEIYFTSGGTEGNNLAIIGSVMANKRNGNKIITSSIEHASVANPMKYLEDEGFEVVYLPVDKNGVIDLEALKNEVDDDTVLVSIMGVNNEVGAIQPMEEIGAIVKEKNPKTLYHIDAIQAFGKMEIKPKKCKADFVTVSGHKIHGPKGTGFIYIKNKTKVRPLILGGGQQMGMRSGTENVPGIAGLGEAAKEAYDNLAANVEKMTVLKDRLIDGLEKMEGVTVNSKRGSESAPHIVSASFLNVRSEVMLHALEDKGVYISAGSACSSNKPAISSTLKAMKIDNNLLESTVRFSFSANNTEEEVDYCLNCIEELLPVLKKYIRK
ncbi:MAG: cysteine desulfurase [Lachnospiraceae bacterium]|nr:cysteine desulfurase [Lachnospiraceae bacterium]